MDSRTVRISRNGLDTKSCGPLEQFASSCGTVTQFLQDGDCFVVRFSTAEAAARFLSLLSNKTATTPSTPSHHTRKNTLLSTPGKENVSPFHNGRNMEKSNGFALHNTANKSHQDPGNRDNKENYKPKPYIEEHKSRRKRGTYKPLSPNTQNVISESFVQGFTKPSSVLPLLPPDVDVSKVVAKLSYLKGVEKIKGRGVQDEKEYSIKSNVTPVSPFREENCCFRCKINTGAEEVLISRDTLESETELLALLSVLLDTDFEAPVVFKVFSHGTQAPIVTRKASALPSPDMLQFVNVIVREGKGTLRNKDQHEKQDADHGISEKAETVCLTEIAATPPAIQLDTLKVQLNSVLELYASETDEKKKVILSRQADALGTEISRNKFYQKEQEQVKVNEAAIDAEAYSSLGCISESRLIYRPVLKLIHMAPTVILSLPASEWAFLLSGLSVVELRCIRHVLPTFNPTQLKQLLFIEQLDNKIKEEIKDVTPKQVYAQPPPSQAAKIPG